MTTTKTTKTFNHPSTRGVHYLYLSDPKGRMVGCIATVRRGQDLFIGTSFCSPSGGDSFRKAQGRSIAEGRALRRAEEQDKLMRIFSHKSVDQTDDAVQFLLRAQHALRVNLDLLTDSTTTDQKPNAFDVLIAILHSVIEFNTDLDDRCDSFYIDSENESAYDLVQGVLTYFDGLDIPGGLVRAAKRKLTAVATEASERTLLSQAVNDLVAQTNVSAQDLLYRAPAANPATTVLGPVIPQ